MYGQSMQVSAAIAIEGATGPTKGNDNSLLNGTYVGSATSIADSSLAISPTANVNGYSYGGSSLAIFANLDKAAVDALKSHANSKEPSASLTVYYTAVDGQTGKNEVVAVLTAKNASIRVESVGMYVTDAQSGTAVAPVAFYASAKLEDVTYKQEQTNEVSYANLAPVNYGVAIAASA